MNYAFPPSGPGYAPTGISRLGRELGIDKAALMGQLALEGGATMLPGKLGGKAFSMAGNPKVLAALKIGTPLAAASSVLGAGDVLFGGDSAGNKIMDGAGMTIGGILGSVGGPMGAAAGAGIGKSASDSLQWLFGDKKSAEQRRMEEALALLQSGVI